jgi:hypothetical protein
VLGYVENAVDHIGQWHEQFVVDKQYLQVEKVVYFSDFWSIINP